MTKDEALRLALEALEPIPYKDDWTVAKETNKAIIAIKEALAQTEQDLVEWGVDWGPDGNSVSIIKRLADGGIEVVGWEYAPHPPQRTWVGLTEDEIVLISADCAATHQHTDIHFAKAIEAKLKERNS
jgi:hypothetical protein